MVWTDDEDHSPAQEFRAHVESDSGYPLFVVGRYNSLAGTLSYALIHRALSRIYALDLGSDHHNPDCHRVGEKHKHRWKDGYRDKQAYVPDDITATWDQPASVWMEFCREAKIEHDGVLRSPQTQQELRL